MDRENWKKYLRIPYLVFAAFIIVVFVLVHYQYYERRIEKNNEENRYKIEVITICEELITEAKTMTYAARNFVQTGDVEYLLLYCDSIINQQQKLQEMNNLEQYMLKEKEKTLLLQINEYLQEANLRTVYAINRTLFEKEIRLLDYRLDNESYQKVKMIENMASNSVPKEWKTTKLDLFLIGEEYEKCMNLIASSINELTIMQQGSVKVVARENEIMAKKSMLIQYASILFVIACVVVMIMQNKKVFSLKNMNEIIISTSKDEYLLIGQADLDEMQVTSLRDDKDNVYGSVSNSRDYVLAMEKYARERVNESFIDNFLLTTEPDFLREKFESGNKIVSYVFKDIHNDWQIIDFVKVRDKVNNHLLVSFTVKNAVGIVEQQKEQRQRDEMLMHFSRDYFEVYVVDLNNGPYEIIRSAERFGNYIKNLSGDFRQLMELAIVSWCKPPYRENFRQLMDLEGVRKTFSEGTNKIEFIYESYDEKWKSLQCFPVPEYGPGNEKMIFALRDFNEEMQIRTNEVLATEAMNTIYAVVAFCDVEANTYVCVHCNDALFQLEEKGSLEEMTSKILNLMHEDDIKKYKKIMSVQQIMREGRAEGEIRLKDIYGKYHYYHEYITRVEIPSGSRMAILIKNVDEAKMHEIWVAEQLQKELKAKAKELEMTKLLAIKSKDLEKALKQAEDANAAKSQFLSNMSHDLRTPMNAILGMTYIAKKHMQDEEQLTKCLNTILSSSENMVALINDILDMNKIESGVLQLKEKSTDLYKVIQDVEDMFRNKCEANQQEFVIDCSEVNNFSYIMDEVRVKQIILNLVSNATKYTPAFGHISLTIKEKSMEKGRSKLIFIIQDDGIGMAQSFIEKIFAPFEREETELFDKVEGSGLGMAIVKNLVDNMNGKIHIDSAPNMGTNITVAIPFKLDESVSDGLVVVEQSVLHKYPGKRVLIVEDKRINMEIVKGFLEETEIAIEEAHNGKEAVERFENSMEGTFDLIFMDMRMPIMKGDEATKMIRRMNRRDSKEIPIIAMTANALDTDVEYSYKCGMNGHISKPIIPEEIYRCLNRWLLGA